MCVGTPWAQEFIQKRRGEHTSCSMSGFGRLQRTRDCLYFFNCTVLAVCTASEMGVQREDGKLKHTPYCHTARGGAAHGSWRGQWCSASLVVQAQGEVCFAVVGLW